jgi:putative oxidoreductase
MLKQYQGFVTLLGRLLIVPIFLGAGYNHITGFIATANMMLTKMPVFKLIGVQILLAGACAFLVLGGLSLLFGFKARFGALLLVIFLLAVTPIFHAFWSSPTDQVQMQTLNFMKNFALLGGLLFIMAFGPGPLSLDEAMARRLK